MQSTKRYSSLAVAIFVALTLSGNAAAQTAPVIRITNANNHEIPLRAGSSVQIDVAGNLLAECALNSSNLCTQLSTGGSTTNPGAPTATLSRTDGDSDVRSGEFVRLAWTSTSALVCNAASTGPVGTAWTGPRGTSNSSGEIAVVGTAGSYAFTLQCFNANGASTLLTQNVEVLAAAVGGTPTGCDIVTSDPAFQPAGWTRFDKGWIVAFSAPDGSPTAVYPNSVGFPVPVGANKGSYTAIPFVAAANLTVDMTWDTAQANGIQGYTNPRPADSMFIGISPCPGDLRAAATAATNDSWLRNGCRRIAGAGSLFYTTAESAVSNDSVCRLTAGQTYYINVSPVDPADGITQGEHTCSTSAPNSGAGCDVQMRHTGSFSQ